ncbi:hypothetical protein ILT44_15760 [Microvirga sp. BT689]|uniref:hypothetical protein n=1 Tax=Microvirga arvi TaxID=2778731 RepID=UPI001951E23D|nr:hypothetical protein [Microvirga arvi]MBM6581653.1 hypothetical protein [Microvirga arvi]
MSQTVIAFDNTAYPQKQLQKLIGEARASHAFGADLDFDAPCWEWAGVNGRRVSSAAKVVRLYFTVNIEGDGRRSPKGMEGRQPLSEPFGSMIKAFIRKSEEEKSKSFSTYHELLRAGRYLHDALAPVGFNPCLATVEHFDAAISAARQREAASSAYMVGTKLEELAHRMAKAHVSLAHLDWGNPVPRPDGYGGRMTLAARTARDDRLPSEEALDALARIANLVTEDADVLRMRAVELLVCGGWRINELLTMPFDCEVEETVEQDGQAVLRYGLRYDGEKGFDWSIKWIPTPMIDIARRAVADLKRVTAAPRQVARFMAKHPGRAALPEPYRLGDPERLLTAAEIGRLLGFPGIAGNTARTWLATHRVPRADPTRARVRQGDVEAVFVARCARPGPTRPGRKALPLHDHLFLLFENTLHATRGTNPFVVDVLTDGQLSDFLTPRFEKQTVFERFGFAAADGGAHSVNTHQFRHWLNTLAQAGGMSQMEIARWSGRKIVAQNAAYDHLSGMELAAKARELLEAGRVTGPINDVFAGLPPVERIRFKETLLATAHTTDVGMCINDWTMAPCAFHGACADCRDHLVVKGSADQRERAQELLEEHLTLVAHAELAVADEEYGAANHLEHNRRMVAQLEKIVAVHDDAGVPDGTLVHLNPSGPSRFEPAGG